MPADNVFFTRCYPTIGYSIEDIIDFHRETNHPTCLNEPNCFLEARIEFDLRTKKKTKMVEWFEGLLDFDHRFDITVNRRVLAIARKREDQEKALTAGANYSGHSDLIKQIEKGLLKLEDDFDVLVCHGDALLDLAPVRGLLKKGFPNKQKGNFGTDMTALVERFKSSISYKMTKDDYDLTYGYITVPFARLGMDKSNIIANFGQLLNKIDEHKPQLPSPGVPFITRVIITADPSTEKLRARHWDILKHYEDPYIKMFADRDGVKDSEDSDDEEAEAAN
jgi:ribosomal protein L1